MSDIYGILNIDPDFIKDFHLLADRVVDHQVEKVIDKNLKALRQIEERMFVGEGLNIAVQSIDETISKVIRMAPSGDTSMDNWTTRELRIVSYYLMKLRDDNACYLYALELLDKNWKNLFFNGLAFYLLSSWHSIEPNYRDLTGQLLIRKLNAYSDVNHRYSLWKNRVNLFDCNGPIRMAALLKAKNKSIAEAPSILGFKNTAIRQEYYSDVIVKYVESNHITDRDSIERVFELHDIDRTKKLVFAYLVEIEEQAGDDISRAQLCRFANAWLGDITLSASWAPFIGATTTEAQRLKKAMRLVNTWFAQQVIESFFEICVQDKDRRLFWLKYVDKISGFKIVGSTAIRLTLQSNSKIGDIFLPHFIETNARSSQTSALILYFKDKVMIEFSDTGALYVYDQTHPIVKSIPDGRYGIASISDLKIPSMGRIVESNYWGEYSVYNEQGKLHHRGNWQGRLGAWINAKLLSANHEIDKELDDKLNAKPLPAENFKPLAAGQEAAVATKEPVVEREALNTETSEFVYKIASRNLENEVRVVANTNGFYLSLGNNRYELIRTFAFGQTPTGKIRIKESDVEGWYEIVYNYDYLCAWTVGFIKITTGEVFFKEEMSAAGKTRYNLY